MHIVDRVLGSGALALFMVCMLTLMACSPTRQTDTPKGPSPGEVAPQSKSSPAKQARVGQSAAIPQDENQSSCSISDSEKPGTSAQRFGSLTNSDRTQEPVWRSYRNENEVRKASESREIDDSAMLWSRGDGTLRVMMTEGTEDAALTLNYCFRSDGTLAASVSTLGSVNSNHPDFDVGPVYQTTRRTFDRCGREITVQVGPLVDLKGKIAPKGTGVMERAGPKVLAMRSLPFFHLIEATMLPSNMLGPPVGCAG